MDKDFAIRSAAEIGIDVEQLIREEAELIFLKGLLESSISDRLIFKGGTALRLVYESPRFSEDLDFSIISGIEFKEFEKIITRLTKSDDRFSIKDLWSKYYTNLAEIKIRESWRQRPLSMKIEISKAVMDKGFTGYKNMLAKSPVTNLSVMAKTYTLDTVLRDKLRAVNERKMPRDIFDIWFVCQKTGKPFTMENFGYPKGELRQELRKFLPKRFYPIVEELEELNAKGL